MENTTTIKIILLGVILIACSSFKTSKAQIPVLWGMTSQGGVGDSSHVSNGNIFSINADGSGFIQRHGFVNVSQGKRPWGSLMQASNGKIYGMTREGGKFNKGVLFQFDPSKNIYTKKVDFNYSRGTYPVGSLIEASNGKFYGMTSFGGYLNNGVLFEFDPLTNAYNIKYDFIVIGGSRPMGSLIRSINGKLYGMTTKAGSYGMGLIFEYDPTANSFIKKFDFDGVNGAQPTGSLLETSTGNLYGMTSGGGLNNAGVLFNYNQITNVYSIKYNFSHFNGYVPTGNLIQASNGKLYGMTFVGSGIIQYYSDYGVLFEYDPSTNIYVNKFDFTFSNGQYPRGSLMMASNGKLYGMTEQGGNYAGVLFEYDITTNSYSKKIDFDFPTTGAAPFFTNLIELKISILATGINATSTRICKNSSTTLKVQGGFLGAGANWHWYSDSCNGTPIGIGDSISVTPSKTTTYFVRAEGSNITTCVKQKIIVLALPLIPLLPESATICPGNSVDISVSGNSVRYEWSPAVGLSSTTNATVTATPASTTVYTVTGTTANGCTKSRLIKVTVQCPQPTGLNTTDITSSTAIANWSTDICASGYKLQYKKINAASPITVMSTQTSDTIIGLKANTEYIWKIASQCSDGSYSQFTPFQNFTTLAFRLGDDINKEESSNSFSIFIHPNPSHDLINLEFNNVTDGDAKIIIRNAMGQVVMQKHITITDGVYSDAIDVRTFSYGVYMISIAKNDEIKSVRFLKD